MPVRGKYMKPSPDFIRKSGWYWDRTCCFPHKLQKEGGGTVTGVFPEIPKEAIEESMSRVLSGQLGYKVNWRLVPEPKDKK